MLTPRDDYAWTPARTIDGTTTTLDFDCKGYPVVVIEVASSTNLSFKTGVKGEEDVARMMGHLLLSGASTETRNAPNTATGTVAAQDLVAIPTLGAKKVTLTRAAGSGTVRGVAMTMDALTSWCALRGITTTLSGGGDATAANQATEIASLAVIAGWDNTASDGASVSGDVAHDTADAGEPVKIGGKALNALPAAVTANDRVNAIFDLIGRLVNAPYTVPENIVSGAITTAMTATTSTSLIAAPGDATLRNYITTLVASCAHATQGTDIVIQDGSGGTTLMTIPAAALYGGAVINLPVPLRQPTLNTAIFCANVTTGSSTKVSAVGYKAP